MQSTMAENASDYEILKFRTKNPEFLNEFFSEKCGIFKEFSSKMKEFS